MSYLNIKRLLENSPLEIIFPILGNTDESSQKRNKDASFFSLLKT